MARPKQGREGSEQRAAGAGTDAARWERERRTRRAVGGTGAARFSVGSGGRAPRGARHGACRDGAGARRLRPRVGAGAGTGLARFRMWAATPAATRSNNAPGQRSTKEHHMFKTNNDRDTGSLKVGTTAGDHEWAAGQKIKIAGDKVRTITFVMGQGEKTHLCFKTQGPVPKGVVEYELVEEA